MEQGTPSGIQPVQGKVVRQAVAHDVVSPAYDALTPAQRRAFRADHPNSYLHVTRSADDEPDAETVDNATLVARGRAALEQLLAHDVFEDHGGPSFYAYRLSYGAHSQIGLVAEVPSAYYHAVARPHEATRPERFALLAEHFATVKAASSPVACAVRDQGQLEALLSQAADSTPVVDMIGDDGLHQTVWRIDDHELASELQAALANQSLFIIDGHHRSAANAHLLASGHHLPVLVALFPEQSLQLVGFHRLLRLPEGVPEGSFLDRVSRRFRVERTSDVASVVRGQVAIAADGEWHFVHFDERPISGSAQVLLGAADPVVLEREILRSIVGAMGDYDVTYMPDTEPFNAIADAAAEQGRVPIFVPPVSIEEMMEIAEGGETMPAKSTYFIPKVRSGLFLRQFDDLI